MGKAYLLVARNIEKFVWNENKSVIEVSKNNNKKQLFIMLFGITKDTNK